MQNMELLYEVSIAGRKGEACKIRYLTLHALNPELIDIKSRTRSRAQAFPTL